MHVIISQKGSIILNDKVLLRWLNWFYTLEMGQIDLYVNQAKQSNDDYIKHVLLKIAEIELNHARMFKDIIIRLGSKPLKIDSLLSYITGLLPGKLTPLFGTVNFFYYNYVIETMAIYDYKKLIKKIEPDSVLHCDLLDILTNNLVEEDIHRSWFKDRRESLQRIKKKQKK